ncbi:FAD-dependent monooxygenase [Sansalvadorimonas sp. 2012CJ34-2]|uniref:FAD-dependent monooxygenase n=1 Tax=Parendozoicomonas callyspongiae TaxID=2942213 RepID=A0ABT0PGC1_9GAMM|nr:FAD-dependent monooxygenase [Sansalvadorimonas sp. 2012CJ34-2]MCL6270286.1 FAD-dependent monooxygenase [Sansalvadorimonas sp. 2012CJ34-2]
MGREFDIIVLGGGISGAAMALALADTPLSVALVDTSALEPVEHDGTFDARVSALTEASRHLLNNLGAWERMVEQRVSPYYGMEVWDAAGTGTIKFSARELAVSRLGHIVENNVTRGALLEKLATTSVHMMGGLEVQGLKKKGDQVELKLWDKSLLHARLVIAADGANSRARGWASIPMREWDYLHHAIVTTVETEKPHKDTAWQVFQHTGPLAFLPLPSENGRNYCSIVWSQIPDEARRLMGLPDEEFCELLEQTIEGKLGRILSCEKRHKFPLRQRHARQYHRGHVVLVGDAAHTIHPLAGQGANLGLLDVASLAGEIKRACERDEDFASKMVLDRYQRSREGHNLAMAGIMEGLQRIFDSDNMLFSWLRNTGLNIVDHLPVLKQEIVTRAMGIKGEIPELARGRKVSVH